MGYLEATATPLIAEVDQVDLGDGLTEKVRAEALELFDGVGGVERANGFAGGGEIWEVGGDNRCGGAGGGVG